MPATAQTAVVTRPERAGRRPVLAWVVGTLNLLAIAWLVGTLLWSMWLAVDRFPEAGWLHQAVQTNLGDPIRILIVVAVWLAAVAVGVGASITGYYAWAGYGWTRWAALIALALGGLAFLGPWLMPFVLIPLAASAVVCWLPPLRRWHTDQDAARHPQTPQGGPAASVFYGPVERFATHV